MSSAPQLTIPEQLAYCTVRIECELANGRSSIGTGFFFHFCQHGDKSIPAVVTNRHVVTGAVRGKIRLNTGNPDGSVVRGMVSEINIEQFESRWIGHPDPS